MLITAPARSAGGAPGGATGPTGPRGPARASKRWRRSGSRAGSARRRRATGRRPRRRRAPAGTASTTPRRRPAATPATGAPTNAATCWAAITRPLAACSRLRGATSGTSAFSARSTTTSVTPYSEASATRRSMVPSGRWRSSRPRPASSAARASRAATCICLRSPRSTAAPPSRPSSSHGSQAAALSSRDEHGGPGQAHRVERHPDLDDAVGQVREAGRGEQRVEAPTQRLAGPVGLRGVGAHGSSLGWMAICKESHCKEVSAKVALRTCPTQGIPVQVPRRSRPSCTRCDSRCSSTCATTACHRDPAGRRAGREHRPDELPPAPAREARVRRGRPGPRGRPGAVVAPGRVRGGRPGPRRRRDARGDHRAARLAVRDPGRPGAALARAPPGRGRALARRGRLERGQHVDDGRGARAR